MPAKSELNDIYQRMGINLDGLGCIMLKVEPLKVSDLIAEEDLYYSSDPNKFWLKGIVSESVPHCTLLFGLMESGGAWKEYVDGVLDGWNPGTVTVDHVGFFETAYDSEPYYCLIAHLVVTPELLDGNARLRHLPHIDTFPEYKAHVTLAYIKNDEQLRDDLLYALNNRFVGKKLTTKGVDYGK
jgi:2'-5' RNA ligase